MESSSELVAFPLLLTPIESNYRACTIPYRFPSDNPRKATPTELSWIDLFLNSIPSFRFLVFILIFFFHFFFCEFLGCWVFGINVIVSNKPISGKMIIFCLFICLMGWVVSLFQNTLLLFLAHLILDAVLPISGAQRTATLTTLTAIYS